MGRWLIYHERNINFNRKDDERTRTHVIYRIDDKDYQENSIFNTIHRYLVHWFPPNDLLNL